MWDAFQREALTALGHVVYRPATPTDVPGAQRGAVDNEAQPLLLRSIARAAGVPVERLTRLPPLDQLRSAAAKRALWPRLRAMRAAARS